MESVSEQNPFDQFREIYNRSNTVSDVNPFDQFRQIVADQSQARTQENLQSMGEFSRGVKRGYEQVKGLLYGATGIAGSVAEDLTGVGESLQNWGYEGYKRKMQEASEYPATYDWKDITKGDNIVDNAGRAVKWATGTMGELVPSMVEAIITGAIGAAGGSAAAPGPGTVAGGLSGFVGKRAVKKMLDETVKQAIKKGLTRTAAKELAEKHVERIGISAIQKQAMKSFGAKAGIVAGVAPLEAGGNWGEMMEQGINNPYSALATGTTAAFLELAGGNSRLVGKILPDKLNIFKQAIKSAEKAGNASLRSKAIRAIAEIGREAATQAPEEFAQEAGQEFLSMVNNAINDPTFEMASQESIERLIGSGLAGAVGGAGGGVGSYVAEKVIPQTAKSLSEKMKDWDKSRKTNPLGDDDTAKEIINDLAGPATFEEPGGTTPLEDIGGVQTEEPTELTNEATPEEIQAFVDRITSGETVSGPKDMQFYSNNSDAIEEALQLKALAEQAGSGGQILEDIPGAGKETTFTPSVEKELVQPDYSATPFEKLKGKLYNKQGKLIEEAPKEGISPFPTSNEVEKQEKPYSLAVKMKNGEIISDDKVSNHHGLIEDHSLNPDDIENSGYVVDGEFYADQKEALKASEQGKEQVHDYSNTQVPLPKDAAKNIVDFGQKIPESEIYTNPEAGYESGREDDPHITVRYGLATDEATELQKAFEKYGPLTAKMGKVSLFEADDHDVVKVDIDSPELRKANELVGNNVDLPGETFKDYKPHATIAYVKKGEGKKYVGNTSFEGKEISFDKIQLSTRTGEIIDIPLKGEQLWTETKEKAVKAEEEKAGGKGSKTTDIEELKKNFKLIVPEDKYRSYRILTKDGFKHASRENMDSTYGFGDPIFNTKEEADNYGIKRKEVDAANAVSSAKWEKEAQEKKAKEEAKKDLKGFDDNLSSMQKGRAVKTLTKNIQYRNKVYSRRDLIEKLINEGYTVNEKRQLEAPDGSFLDSRALTKTGIDYAEYLQKQVKNIPENIPEREKSAGSVSFDFKKEFEEQNTKTIEGLSYVGKLLKREELDNGWIRKTWEQVGEAEKKESKGLLKEQKTSEEITEPVKMEEAIGDFFSGDNKKNIGDWWDSLPRGQRKFALRKTILEDQSDHISQINWKDLSENDHKYITEAFNNIRKAGAEIGKGVKTPESVDTTEVKDYNNIKASEMSADDLLAEWDRQAGEQEEETVEFIVQPLTGGPAESLTVHKTPTARAKALETRKHISNAVDKFKEINKILGEKGALSLEKVDETKWQLIRPLLKEAWDEVVAAGKSGAEFVALAIKNLSPKGRPYFEKFVREEIENGKDQSSRTEVVDNETGVSSDLRTGESTENVSNEPTETVQQPERGSSVSGQVSERAEGQGSEQGSERGDSGEHGVSDRGGNEGAATGRNGIQDSDLGRGSTRESELPEEDRNHIILDDDVIVPAGPETRIKANIKAIQLLKKLQSENRNPSTKEKKILAQYVGWGAFSQKIFKREYKAFLKNVDKYTPEKWFGDGEELKNYKTWETKYGKLLHPALGGAMTEEEWDSAETSTINAHYTTRTIIDSMWKLAEQLGFKGGLIAEPAGGVGHFFGLMPQNIAKNSSLQAVEKDTISGQIMQKLYPQANVEITPFEKSRTIADNSLDLVITNVPFADVRISDKKHPDYSGWSLHNYYFARSLTATKPGGLVIAITSAWTMDAKSNGKTREYLGNQADLIGAIRLPNTAFKENAGTDVTTDILVFRKKDNESSSNGYEFRTTRTLPSKENIAAEEKYKKIRDEIESLKNLRNKSKSDKKKIYTDKISNKQTELDEAFKEMQEGYAVNEYFMDHPEMVLGTHSMKDTMYAKNTYTLAPSGDLVTQLKDAIEKFPTDIAGEGTDVSKIKKVEYAELGDKEGTLVKKDNKIMMVDDGKLVTPYYLDAKGNKKKVTEPAKVKRLSKYMELREFTVDLFNFMATEEATDAEINSRIKKLNSLYDDYVKKYQEFGNVSNSFIRKIDNDFAIVDSLEIEEEEGGVKTFKKADIFSKRTIFPFREPTSADNIEDAVGLSIVYKGSIIPAYVAELTGVSIEDVRKKIVETGTGFINPATGRIEQRDQYLSGNVKKKLEAAKIAAQDNKDYDVNVKALEAIIPDDIDIEFISLRLGSSWIPADCIKDFIKEVIDVNTSIEYVKTEGTSRWVVEPLSNSRNVKNMETFGTKSHTALELIEAALNLHRVKAMVPNADGKGTHEDKDLSKESNLKANEISDEFARWAKTHKTWADKLSKIYNEEKNGTVLRKHEAPNIEYYPNASHAIKLRKHQKIAVSRALQESTLLAYGVGTGKTFIYITTAMEMKRIGTARKPLIVVHNATVDQYRASFQTLYPGAKALIPNWQQRSSKMRKKTLVSMATGDWDAIVLPQSFFDSIANDPEREKAFVEEKIAEIDDTINEMDEKGGDYWTVKDLVKLKERKRQQLDRLLDRRKDEAVLFEQMGIDALLIDEVHNYKRSEFSTKMNNVKGIDNGASQRSASLILKSDFIRNKTGGKNIITATGTPISNTMAELWTMLRYVRPELLEDYGVSLFDDFAGAFGMVEEGIEETASGFKEVERFAKYVNGPELLTMFFSGADVRLTKDANLNLPKMVGGKPQVVVSDKSPELTTYIKNIIAEWRRWEKLPGRDKAKQKHVPLVLYGRARKATIDLRMIDPDFYKEDPNGKLARVSNKTYEIWKDTKSDRSTQIIFLDIFQDSGKNPKFNAHKEMKSQMVKLGIPEKEIILYSEAGTSDKKQARFKEMIRSGEARVIIGSSARLGVGVDIANKLVAAHHVNVPDRPMDIEQRDGRIIRQGNENKEVQIYHYCTKDSLDSVMFNRLLKKQKFADQILTGDIDGRTFNDPFSAEQASFAEFAAATSGKAGKLLFEKNELVANERKYRIAEQAFIRKKSEANRQLRSIPDDIEHYEKELIQAEETKSKIEKMFPDGKVDTFKYNGEELDRSEFFKQYDKVLEQKEKEAFSQFDNMTFGDFANLRDPKKEDTIITFKAGELNVTVRADLNTNFDSKIWLKKPSTKIKIGNEQEDGSMKAYTWFYITVSFEGARLGGTTSWEPKSNITRFINDRISNVLERPSLLQERIDKSHEDLAEYESISKEKFKYGNELADAQKRIKEIDKELIALSREEESGEVNTEEKAETDIDAAINRVADRITDERGSLSFSKIKGTPLHEDLITVGSHYYNQGHQRLSDFTNKMKDAFSSIWKKIKYLVKFIWNDVKTRLKSERGSIGGELSRTAPKSMLAKAQDMASEGKSEQEIWKETGWLKGVEGKWKYEIDDSKAKFKIKPDENGEIYKPSSLGEILYHPELFKAYPKLRNMLTTISVEKGLKTSGQYTPGEDRSAEGLFDLEPEIKIFSDNIDRAKETLFHEIQHAVQDIEGFARGGNLLSVRDLPEYKTALRMAREYKETGEIDGWSNISTLPEKGMDEDVIALAIYKRLAGEVEARDTEDRINRTTEERKETIPYSSTTIPKDQWIVKTNNNGESRSIQTEDAVNNEITDNSIGFVKNIGDIFKKSKTGWKTQKPDTSLIDRIINLPSHYFEKIPALKRMYEAALSRTDNYWQYLDALTKGTEGNYYTEDMRKFQKQDPEGYKKFQEYLVDRDRNAIGYNVEQSEAGEQWVLFNHKRQRIGTYDTEERAWASAILDEVIKAKEAGWSDQAVNALKGARLITHNGFRVLMQNLKEIIVRYEELGLDLPSTVVKGEGNKKVEVDLKMALAKMGDIRGHYMPRVRRSGRYMLTATKKGENPILEFYDFKGPVAGALFPNSMLRRQTELERKGYRVSKDVSSAMPEDVFEMAGSVVAMQAQINEALKRVQSQELKLEDFGLQHIDRIVDAKYNRVTVNERMISPGLRDFVVTGPAPKWMSPVFKDLGGKFYSAYAGEPRSWHFYNPGRNFEKRLTKALALKNTKEIIDQEMQALFAKNMAEQVANIIKSRGHRAHMIERTDAKGKDVWLGYEEDPAVALGKYARGIAAGEAKKIMARDMITAFTGTDISWQDFKAAKEFEGEKPKYEEYLEMVDERRVDPVKQKNAFRDGKIYMEDILRNEEFADRFMGTLKGIAVLKYLGGRISAPLVNLTALVTSVPAAMNGYADISITKGIRLIGDAAKAYGQYKFGDRKTMDKNLVSLFDEIESRGWHKSQHNQEALNVLESKLSRGWKKFIEISMLGFGATEQLNRVSTIAGAYLGIKENTPGMDHDAAMELAKKISDRSHGVYGKANYPNIARGQGVANQVIKSFYVFKTFSHNYIMTMREMWGPSWTPKHAKAFSYMALSPAVLAGAGASVFTPLIAAMARGLGIGGDDPEEEVYKWLSENFGEYAENIGRSGVFGLAGINLKGSLSIGVTDLPTTIPDILGAPGSMITDLYKGGENILKGNVLKGLENMLPLALSNPVKAVRESTEGVTTRTNAPVFYGNEPLVANTVDALLRAASFNPSRISNIREKLWKERKIEQEYTEKRADLYSKIKKYLLQPAEKRSKADWIDIISEVNEYNKTLEKRGYKMIPRITSKSIKNNIQRAFRPSKRERMREAM